MFVGFSEALNTCDFLTFNTYSIAYQSYYCYSMRVAV